VGKFENALALTLVKEAHLELQQAPNSKTRYDIALSHLTRIERSINPKLLEPETKLVLEELKAGLNHQISIGGHRPTLERLNPRGRLVTAFSRLFTTPMPDSLDDLSKIVAGTRDFSDLLTQEIKSLRVGNDPSATKATINALKNLLDGTEPLDDYRYRVRSLGLPTTEASTLNNAYKALYISVVVPRIEVLLEKLKDQTPQRTSVGALPNGKNFYDMRIRQASSLLASEIHILGLNELERLHHRIEVISEKPVGIIFRDTRNSPHNYFPNSDTGRHQYLNGAYGIIEDAVQYFDIPLKPLTVKAVDSYRSKYATTFDYFGATLHANLSDMKNLPRYELASQVRFHSVPGLHLAHEKGGSAYSLTAFSTYLSINPETENLDALLHLIDSTSLMVIDTGIHALDWSQQRAVDFMIENTALPRARVVKYVNEVYVEPGRWVLPALGRLTINQLASQYGVDYAAMGKILLSLGPQPTTVLEKYLVEHSLGDRALMGDQERANQRLRSGLPPRYDVESTSTKRNSNNNDLAEGR